jgi:glyoxylase-like metal-dependent hydrolase (beta-lactamase superfamily II)
MKLLKCAALFFLLLLISDTTSLASEYFEVQKVAEGVYTAIGKPGVLCNAAIIITEDGVIVVDTHLRPAWARDLIQEIKKLTDKPVRYVINTHWNPDHVQGNKTYASIFGKQTEFISHHNTRDDIIGKAIPNIKQSLADTPKRITQLKSHLESGKKLDGTALSDEEKTQLSVQIKNSEEYLEELKTLEITVPNMTFDKSLILYAADKEVRILYFGEGHTRGDVVIHLPKEKVLITGDLLTGGLLFMRDAIPTAWSATLANIGRLDFDLVVPGHGRVQKRKDRLNLVVNYLNDLVAAVKAQVEKGATLDETMKNVDLSKYEKEFENFKAGLTGPNGNITKTYEALKK